MKFFKIIILLCVVIVSCEKDNYEPSNSTNESGYQEGEEFLTGHLGVNSTSNNAFGFEVHGLSFKDQARFATGNSLFNQSWVSSPASTTGRDGLGPTFNARACANCHFKDGRGKPLTNGVAATGFLMRVSLDGKDANGGPKPTLSYGAQIQDLANNGIDYEAKVNVNYTTITGTYSDGTTYELQQPNYTFTDENFGSLSGIKTSPRVGQQTIGLGFISALPDSEIIKFQDEFDNDKDGISGRVNFVWNPETKAEEIGRYGWKANAPTLKIQVAGAFHGDMGLTTSIFKDNNCPSPQNDCNNAPNGGDPEVTDTQLDQVLFYQASLAVPNRRNAKDNEVLKGKAIFNKLNCIGCHAINQKTGTSKINPIIKDITIKPYSDFLLHDMGDALADNREDFKASGKEWRTQPLWGIGLISTVNKHTFLLHDGRARNIEEAILWHGGEAEKSTTAFKQLPKTEREQLISFIKSL